MPDVAEAEAAWLARLAASLSQNAARVLPCARRAAVACLLRQSPGGLECFFIIRAAHPGDPWSGDVAWPGGRVEAGETDLQAAIRETREEVGLHLDESCYQLLGPLDDRPAVRKKGRATLVVRTFIFVQRAPETAPLQLQPKEVAAAWWVPLSLLTSCPQPLPLFRVPVTRLSTRFPALRNRRLCSVLRVVGLDAALFPCIPLPPPPQVAGPVRLWGVTLGLCELLVAASDGEAATLVVPRWRMRHVLWDLLLRLSGWT